jgi:hypothetical protein
LTGRKYLTADTIQALVDLSASPPPFVPGSELADVPKSCLQILEKCMELVPENRYRNAQTLADDLRRFVVDVSRDDSGSRLPLPGENPFSGGLGETPRLRNSNPLYRLGRFLLGRRTPES